MKKLLLLLLLSLSSCTAVIKGIDQVKQVRDAINNLLPADFKGNADLQRHDAYFDISLKAGNLHKNEKGEWTWDWIDYQRLTHFPTWSSTVNVKLGTPAP